MIAAPDPRFAELACLDRSGGSNTMAFLGLSLAITTATETIYARGHGFADAAAKTPVEPHHLFEIGSVGKSFTSIAAPAHARTWADRFPPPRGGLPALVLGQSEYELITIHHPLTHTAGNHRLGCCGRRPLRSVAPRETEVSGPPGTVSIESNVGYKTLGISLKTCSARTTVMR